MDITESAARSMCGTQTSRNGNKNGFRESRGRLKAKQQTESAHMLSRDGSLVTCGECCCLPGWGHFPATKGGSERREQAALSSLDRVEASWT